MKSEGAVSGVKGLSEKRGWYYYRPPTPKDGSARPNRVALKTRDLVEALGKLDELRFRIAMARAELQRRIGEITGRLPPAQANASSLIF